MKHPNPRSQLFFKAINKLGWEREQVVWEEKNNKSELENFCQTVAWVKKSAYQWSSASISGNLLLSPFPPKKIQRYLWKTTVSQTLRTSCWDSAFCMFIQVWRKKKKPHKNTYTVFFQFYTYHKPDTPKGSFQNSMLLNNELLNGKGKNDEILKRILWTYFLVSGADWKYDTFSCFFFLDAKFNQE